MAMDKVLKGKKLKEKLLIFDIEIIVNLDQKQLMTENPMCIQTTTYVPVYNLLTFIFPHKTGAN